MFAFYKKILHEDSGVLTFEWILIMVVLVIGIVGGLSALRNATGVIFVKASAAAGALNQNFESPDGTYGSFDGNTKYVTPTPPSDGDGSGDIVNVPIGR